MGDVLTWLTGIATLVGFAVQVFDLFPRFAKQRNAVVLLLIGVFVGSTLRAFDSAKLVFDLTVSGGVVLVGVFVVVILGAVIAAAATTDRIRRSELYAVAGFAAAPFVMFVLPAVGMSSIDAPTVQERERASLTIGELNGLSERALLAGDFDRAANRQPLGDGDLCGLCSGQLSALP